MNCSRQHGLWAASMNNITSRSESNVRSFKMGKTVISKMSAEEVYNNSLEWAKEYDSELADMLEDKDYALKVYGMERNW